ncbi:MAG TPA: DUF3293 domain-containing protein [Acetobacteraceae bacterium]|nr:DUF3293 domain-containing protein [Acetobacteraceae bacterium]
MRRPHLPEGLRAAYGRTDYEAEGAVARIGERSPAVDAVLARLGARRGAFVTAWNPYSRRMPAGWNARMQARLREAARRHAFAEGTGRARRRIPRRPLVERWAERHLLIAADPRRIAVLGRRFRQHAIMVARRGAPGVLVPIRRQAALPVSVS